MDLGLGDPSKLAIAYGVTGGRHPQMLGLAVAINRRFEAEGFEVVAHFGFSGGAIVAAVMATGTHEVEGQPEEWLRRSTPYGKHGKIGGFPNILCNIWNLFRHGGLLQATDLYEDVFKPMFGGVELKVPAFCGAWCVSHSREVLYDLRIGDPAKSVCCSAALPFAISQMPVLNQELYALGYADVLPGINDDLDGYSYFADAGISSSLGVGIIDNAGAIADIENESGIPVPVIGINIDPIAPGHISDFGSNPWYKKIWEACWGTIRANVLDDVREAQSERYLQLCVAPTPEELMKFSTKFDASVEENLTLYRVGYEQGQEWLSQEMDGAANPVEAMKRWYEQAAANGAGSE